MSIALSVNKGLQHLKLGNNNIENEGGENLADGLAANDKLLSLSLKMNALGDSAIKKILTSFKIHKTLARLNLFNIQAILSPVIQDQLKQFSGSKSIKYTLI